jgi:DNA-binding MarR family transcriptional regulator
MTRKRHQSPIEEAVAYRIHRTNRLLLTHLARFLDSHSGELSPEKYFIVMKLHEAGPLPQSELVEVALDDGPNVSRLVERLVTAGLVQRTENPSDRRARVLDLTAEGRSLARRLEADIADERGIVFDRISDRDLDALKSVLDQLVANIRPALLTGAPSGAPS